MLAALLIAATTAGCRTGASSAAPGAAPLDQPLQQPSIAELKAKLVDGMTMRDYRRFASLWADWPADTSDHPRAMKLQFANSRAKIWWSPHKSDPYATLQSARISSR